MCMSDVILVASIVRDIIIVLGKRIDNLIAEWWHLTITQLDHCTKGGLYLKVLK